MKLQVTTTSLEMTSIDQMLPGSIQHPDAIIIQAEISSPELNRFMFMSVGRPWQWYSRLSWKRKDWQQYLDSPDVQTWIGYLRGTPFGYFELEKTADSSVEIKFFGLLSAFIGQGLGGWLLQKTIEKSWDMEASRVWLHTCTLDHPSALDNYQSRGFTVFNVESEIEEVPDEDDPVWLSPGFFDK
jgi:GNAT superfamily N-acetyltransferase